MGGMEVLRPAYSHRHFAASAPDAIFRSLQSYLGDVRERFPSTYKRRVLLPKVPRRHGSRPHATCPCYRRAGSTSSLGAKRRTAKAVYRPGEARRLPRQRCRPRQHDRLRLPATDLVHHTASNIAVCRQPGEAGPAQVEGTLVLCVGNLLPGTPAHCIEALSRLDWKPDRRRGGPQLANLERCPRHGVEKRVRMSGKYRMR